MKRKVAGTKRTSSPAKRKPKSRAKTSPLEEELDRQIKSAKLVKPKREHIFASPRRWRFDFAFVDHMIAVEVEGGLWQRGRHNRPAGMIADMEKYNEAALLGWTVLRVASPHIKDGDALAWIRRALAHRLL